METDLSRIARIQQEIYRSMRMPMSKKEDDLVTILSGIGLPPSMLELPGTAPNLMQPAPRPNTPAMNKQYDSDTVQRQLREAQMEAETHSRADRLLRDRLLGIRGRFDLAQHEMMMAHVHHDTVYVFYVFEGGRAGHVTDPIDLFPSDELVTQLRILRNA